MRSFLLPIGIRGRVLPVPALVMVLVIVTTTTFVAGFTSTDTASRTRTASTVASISSSTALFLGPPKIDEWKVLKSGAVRGTVSNHPELPDGYEITTSPLDTDTPRDNAVVVTLSGSKYRLLTGVGGSGSGSGSEKTKTKPKAKPKARAIAKAKAKPAPPPKPKAKPKPVKKAAAKTKATTTTTSSSSNTNDDDDFDYNLNGKVVGGKGNTRYLLVGTQIRSSSKRSQIYYAYEADAKASEGVNLPKPGGNRLTVKLASNRERLRTESQNYDRVFSKGRVAFSLQGSGSCYVKKVALLENAVVDSSAYTKGIPKGSSALVLESGDKNLRTVCSESGGGLRNSALRRAAVSICQCVEAMHSSGLVWTDLKAENFVLQQNGGGGNDATVKGIDLESAVAVRSAPEDYSPEACPPEFAAAEKANRGYDFQCLKNYDTWSIGMIFYELSTGSNYFRGKSEDAITRLLATPEQLLDTETGRVKGLEAVPDANMRDLVDKCLDIDPKKRPSIGQILLHPYFLTTGLGPFTF